METKTEIKIDEWCFTSIIPYKPPMKYQQLISNKIFLYGKVYGHPKYKDGKRITTSRVMECKNGVVTTRSGSEYKLLEPDPQYVEWCREEGYHIPTKEEPIKY